MAQVEEKVRVFVLHDRRIINKPTWLSLNFVDKHEQITESTDKGMAHFEIFSGEFAAGKVCLGENGCTKALDSHGGCSNCEKGSYRVFQGGECHHASGNLVVMLFDGVGLYQSLHFQLFQKTKNPIAMDSFLQ